MVKIYFKTRKNEAVFSLFCILFAIKTKKVMKKEQRAFAYCSFFKH